MAKPQVEITCELAFSDDHKLTPREAKAFEKALRAAVTQILPHKMRACWVSRNGPFLGKKREQTSVPAWLDPSVLASK